MKNRNMWPLAIIIGAVLVVGAFFVGSQITGAAVDVPGTIPTSNEFCDGAFAANYPCEQVMNQNHDYLNTLIKIVARKKAPEQWFVNRVAELSACDLPDGEPASQSLYLNFPATDPLTETITDVSHMLNWPVEETAWQVMKAFAPAEITWYSVANVNPNSPTPDPGNIGCTCNCKKTWTVITKADGSQELVWT